MSNNQKATGNKPSAVSAKRLIDLPTDTVYFLESDNKF